MDLERIIGSIVTESGPQPFVLHTLSGKLEVGRYTEADEAQADLTITQQQRFVQLIAERADVTFAKVRLGQYYDVKNDRWVDVLHEAWDGPLEPPHPATPMLGSVNVFETTPATPVEAVEAAETTPATPVEAVEAAEAAPTTPVAPAPPVEAIEAAPTTPVAPALPVEAVEVTPTTSSTPVEVTPDTPVEVTPSTPAAPVEAAPTTPVAPAPPVEAIEAAPSTPATPSTSAAPSTPVEVTPSTPVEVTPSTPIEATPSTPVEVTPSTPAAPVETVEAEPRVLAEEFEIAPPAPTSPAAPVEVEEVADVETEAAAAMGAEQPPEPEAPLLEWDVDAEGMVVEDRAPDEEAVIDAVLLPNEAVMLEKAIRIAVEAHGGQLDKAGDLYILHPLRMMLQMPAPTEMMVAVLHDIVEDTGWTLEALRHEGFSEAVVEAVDGLTRRPDESYEAFIERAAHHPIARRVKLADLEDNMNVRRLDALTEKDQARLARYLMAWRKLHDGGL